MKLQILNIICLLAFLLGTTGIKAQSLVEDVSLSSTGGGGNSFNETIKVISSSKKIFILTNNNQQLGQGDFVSLALENKLAARALVAKTHQGQVGIKILKIYSMAQWGKLHRDQEVQVIKGDDSTFAAPPPPPMTEQTSKIKSEDDLFTGDVVVEEELAEFDEHKNRHIKPDNIVALFGGFLQGNKPTSEKGLADGTDDGGSVRGNQFGLSWAYQFSDNYFAEGAYGRTLFDGFPADGKQTLVNHVMLRLKYNFKGPLYTFFMPYAGFHTYSVSSPDAGDTNNNQINQKQVDAINELKKSGPAFGVTVLRRLVPGWFVQANLGTDMINLGFSIEF